MNNSILRQVTDIQLQADRLIKEKVSLEQISQFAQYSDEIKSFLLSIIKDDFVLNYINEIPDLNLEEEIKPSGVIGILALIFGGIGGSYYNEKRKIDNAKNNIREIRNKYASAEFMLKNYFN
ncbi:hypothetical protein [Aquimarina algiphila]|uniref:hypothetical protein n=1 Tax=Aquimarina algiphila TaxID=2047982 RepID=UPI0024910412|nr:hypothetical protein [Aquimarina algiphila]